MKSYIDIHILQDPEFMSNQILSVLYSKLHRALVQIQSTGIGVSFPQESRTGLGNHLRLHGTHEILSDLMKTNWLVGLVDHLNVGEIMNRPIECKFRNVQRAQSKSSPERLRRRAMRRHGLDRKAALEKIPDSAAEFINLPYVRMTSSSTQQPFRLFIRHGPLLDKEVKGNFSTYGLSHLATVPWF